MCIYIYIIYKTNKFINLIEYDMNNYLINLKKKQDTLLGCIYISIKKNEGIYLLFFYYMKIKLFFLYNTVKCFLK